MRIKDYKFQLINIECLPTSVHLNLIMNFDEDIKDLLPYIAACLPGCTYIHGTDIINFTEKYHIVAIKPREITITRVKNEKQARELCEYWKDFINETEEVKDSIEPVYEKKVEIGPLDIYRALPATNCGECGYPTCMAFAAAVVKREADIENCKPFFTDTDSGVRSLLLDKLQKAGLIQLTHDRKEKELNEGARI